MPDDTPPPQLVQARVDFMAAAAELARTAAAAPSAFAEDGTVVGADPEFAARMNAARGRMQELALFISAHEWLVQAPNRVQAWQRTDAAAKAAG